MINPDLKDFRFIEEPFVQSLNTNPYSHPLFSGVRMEFLNFDDHTFDSVALFTRQEQCLNVDELDYTSKKSNLWNIQSKQTSLRRNLRGWTL